MDFFEHCQCVHLATWSVFIRNINRFQKGHPNWSGLPTPPKKWSPPKKGETLCFHLGIPFRSSKWAIFVTLSAQVPCILRSATFRAKKSTMRLPKTSEIWDELDEQLRFNMLETLFAIEHLQNLATVPDPKSFGASFGTANISPVYCSILQYWRIGPSWADSTRFEG